MNNYDLILVGAGISNIMCALKCLSEKPTLKVLMLEKGNSIDKRRCPKSQIGKCVRCHPMCNISGGFAGAGAFSDGKLTYSPEVGGELVDYIGKDKFEELLCVADNIFTEYGGSSKEIIVPNEYTDKFSNECQRYGMRLIKSKVRHLGSDGLYEVIENMYDKLCSYPNVTIKCNTDVTDVDFENKIVCTMTDTFKADNIVIAVGRSGSDWLRKQCEIQGVKVSNGNISIGVRVECPHIVTKEVTDNLYEFKIINYSSTENRVRTFCVNPQGSVVQENYADDLIGVNGHSLLNTKTENTNFALLVECHFTDPFDEPLKYGQSICRLANMLAGNKVMVQRLVDLKAKKRSTKERMKRLSISPTLTDVEPGDFRYVFPANVIDSLVETLDSMANIIPNINGKNTILYGPEVKFFSSKIEVNDKLELTDYPNVYCMGDSSGITRGIMQASIAGLYVAENIIKENKDE